VSRIERKDLDRILLDFEEEKLRDFYGDWYDPECQFDGDYSFLIYPEEGCLFVYDIVHYKEFSCRIEDVFSRILL